MHKSTGEVWDPDRLVFLVLRSIFACTKPQKRAGTIQTCNSGPNVAVLHAQIHRSGLGPIETCNSDPKVAVLFKQIQR